MKDIEEKYRESLAQIYHLKANETKQAFKQQRHFNHLFEFERWIDEQEELLRFMRIDLLTNPKMKERVEKVERYHNNMVKAFNYTCELFTLMNYAELKVIELNKAVFRLLDKNKSLENELNRLKEIDNF